MVVVMAAAAVAAAMGEELKMALSVVAEPDLRSRFASIARRNKHGEASRNLREGEEG